MSYCTCCCFHPKYKKKVDNIYPRNPDAPLIKNEVDKLQYYVQIHPEKLSKVGEYLYHNLKRGLNGSHKNQNYVKNTVEAVDKILMAITSQNLNYYAVNYLKIIQKLLEQGGGSNFNSNTNINGSTSTESLDYQKLAAGLFRKFCEKEASNMSTINYNLNYDTFVCQFSSMCYNNNKDEKKRADIRSSGLMCLGTMVKRLVPDDSLRAAYLWDNMDKIIPAILFIMHENFNISNSLRKKSSKENNLDKIELNDEEQLNLDRYLYGDFFLNSRAIKTSTSNQLNNENDDADADANGINVENVQIRFKKKKKKHADNNNSETESNGSSASIIVINQKTGQSPTNNNNSSNSSKMKRNLNEKDQSSPSETNNMITTSDKLTKSNNDIIDSDHEAKLLLKNLASKSDYTTISKIIAPILAYLDDNTVRDDTLVSSTDDSITLKGWKNFMFVKCIFLIVMYNVKQQHAIVIKDLMKHLDFHRNSSAKLKSCIIKAISVCIQIAAMHSVGTTGQIIEIFTNLLKQLSYSVEKVVTIKKKLEKQLQPTSNNNNTKQETTTSRKTKEIDEQDSFQKEIISAMGQFTTHLPDYAKNDVVMFIARQINSQQYNYLDLKVDQTVLRKNSHESTTSSLSSLNLRNEENINLRKEYSILLRNKHFECLSEICTKYRPTQLFGAFTSITFLEDFLHLTLASEWFSRLKAHEILHHLLDKNQLLKKISNITPSLFNAYREPKTINNLTTDKNNTTKAFKQLSDKLTRNRTFLSQIDLSRLPFATNREDLQFMRKYGRLFLAHLNENLFMSNNHPENYESVFLTLLLIAVGIVNEKEFLVDLIHFGFHVQELALLNHKEDEFSLECQYNLHKFICAYFLLLSKLSDIEPFYDYCSKISDLRKHSAYFKYIYPQYLLLENPNLESTVEEDDSRLKKELEASSNEYVCFINEKNTKTQHIPSQQEKPIEKPISLNIKNSLNSESPTESNVNDDDNDRLTMINPEEMQANSKSGKQSEFASASTFAASNNKASESSKEPNFAEWLFDKKIIGKVLEEVGISTKILFVENKDYSLAVSYLQQTIAPLKTVLRFRSPYSNSYDSLTALNTYDQQLAASELQYPSFHRRGPSNAHPGLAASSSANPMGISPRRSLDAESNIYDDTSYDSTSQISMDQPIYSFNNELNSQQLKNSTDQTANNELTLSVINQSKQDTNSFETLKRVLFNSQYNIDTLYSGMSSNNSTTNTTTNNTQISNNKESTTTGSNHRNLSIQISNESILQQQHQQQQRQQSLANNTSSNANNTNNSTNSNNIKIINDFKQKTFDELKQNLVKNNQHSNNEKFQQVLDSINKEISSLNSNSNTNSPLGNSNTNNQNAGSNLQPNGMSSLSNALSNFNEKISLNQKTNQSNHLKENIGNRQKMIPLNDIEFPQLFMY